MKIILCNTYFILLTLLLNKVPYSSSTGTNPDESVTSGTKATDTDKHSSQTDSPATAYLQKSASFPVQTKNSETADSANKQLRKIQSAPARFRSHGPRTAYDQTAEMNFKYFNGKEGYEFVRTVIFFRHATRTANEEISDGMKGRLGTIRDLILEIYSVDKDEEKCYNKQLESWSIHQDVLTKEVKDLTKKGQLEIQAIGSRFRKLAQLSPVVREFLNKVDQIPRLTIEDKLDILSLIFVQLEYPETYKIGDNLAPIHNIVKLLDYQILTNSSSTKVKTMLGLLSRSDTSIETETDKLDKFHEILRTLGYHEFTEDQKLTKIEAIYKEIGYGLLIQEKLTEDLKSVNRYIRGKYEIRRITILEKLFKSVEYTGSDIDRKLTLVNEMLNQLTFTEDINTTHDLNKLQTLFSSVHGSVTLFDEKFKEQFYDILPSGKEDQIFCDDQIQRVSELFSEYQMPNRTNATKIQEFNEILRTLSYPAFLEKEEKLQKLDVILKILKKEALDEQRKLTDILKVLGYHKMNMHWEVQKQREIIQIIQFPILTEEDKILKVDELLKILKYSVLTEESKMTKLTHLLNDGNNKFLIQTQFTKTPRTIESSRFFLRGLLNMYLEDNPKQITGDQHKLLKYDTTCDNWKYLVKKNRDNLEKIENTKNSKEVQNVINRVTKRCGFPPNSLTYNDLELLSHTWGYELAWKDHSAWADILYPEEMQVLQWVEDFQLYMEAGASNKLNSQVACNFFKEVVTRLGLDYVEQDGQKKLKTLTKDAILTVLTGFFGHVSGLLKFADLLGLFDEDILRNLNSYEEAKDRLWNTSKIGNFASNISLSLVQKISAPEELFIVVMYQEKLTYIPKCKNKVPNEKYLCPVKDFLEIFADTVKNCDWKELCEAGDNRDDLAEKMVQSIKDSKKRLQNDMDKNSSVMRLTTEDKDKPRSNDVPYIEEIKNMPVLQILADIAHKYNGKSQTEIKNINEEFQFDSKICAIPTLTMTYLEDNSLKCYKNSIVYYLESIWKSFKLGLDEMKILELYKDAEHISPLINNLKQYDFNRSTPMSPDEVNTRNDPREIMKYIYQTVAEIVNHYRKILLLYTDTSEQIQLLKEFMSLNEYFLSERRILNFYQNSCHASTELFNQVSAQCTRYVETTFTRNVYEVIPTAYYKKAETRTNPVTEALEEFEGNQQNRNIFVLLKSILDLNNGEKGSKQVYVETEIYKIHKVICGASQEEVDKEVSAVELKEDSPSSDEESENE